MIKKSVVFKLFIITTVMILFIFSFILLAEGLFFERFYTTSKIGKLEHSTMQFASQYVADHKTGIEKSRLLGQFMNDNDASIAIFNQAYQRISFDPYFIQLQSDSKTISIVIPSDGMMMNEIPSGLQVGDTLTVDGIFMDEKDTIMQPVNIQSQGYTVNDGLVRVEGTIQDLLLPKQRSLNPFYQDSLITNGLGKWMEKAEQYQSKLQSGQPVYMEWRDEWSGIQYAVVVLQLISSGGADRYVLAMTSLQPVGEAVSILKQYYIYLVPVILVLVTLLSLIFSRIISRPLIKLSKSAARMAKLDFSMTSVITSKDEFGELSRSMNSLSYNLTTALNQLTEANTKLQEEMEEKQRSEQLRKELIANISHELKTPLGIVKGFAEGLQDDVASNKRDRYLALIVNETDRMNALIMDMLELSKFEAKVIRLHPQNFALDPMIKTAVASFIHELESKGLEVKIEESTLFTVKADPRRIEQVIVNLLSNAVRYGADNSIIGISTTTNQAQDIMVTIENQGSAIAEEDLNRIWDQFYRTERSRDRKSGGTGLGLAIVKNILELHGSRYGVENTDQGVAFYFSLERAE